MKEQKNKIENWLQDNLYDIIYDENSVKVEQFDYSYIDMINYILLEKFGTSEGLNKLKELKNLCDIKNNIDFFKRDNSKELVNKIYSFDIKSEDYSPKKSSENFKILQEYKKPDAWSKAEGVVINDNEPDKINTLQKEYSIQSKGYMDKIFNNLARPETGDVWTNLITSLIENKVVNGNNPSLSIGCRWAGEIQYFRSIGLKHMVGLDLFSRYPDLVHVGDMHNMKYPDNYFGLIYQRNTFDKSYDIRKAIEECIRTLKPGGVLIYDDVQNYSCGVNELARSNVVCNKWVISNLNINNNIEEILYNKQTPCDWQYCNFIGQLAIKIRK